jgi:hypothetical protein
MTATRDRLLPLRSRVVVAILALCGVSVTLIGIDGVGAGHIIGFGAGASARAETCLFTPRGCDSATIGDGAVTVGRSKKKPGAPSRPGASEIVRRIIVVPAPILGPGNLAFVCNILMPKPWYCPAEKTIDTPSRPGSRPVTLSDLVAFRPRSIALTTEPDGWGIVGLPVNLVGASASHIRAGQLFAEPARVQFIPVRYQWSFGDGTRITTISPGLSWSRLNQPPFSSTPTSHVYERAGTYAAVVSVVYRARYSIAGGGWHDVAGRLLRTDRAVVQLHNGGMPLLVGRACGHTSGVPGC